MRTFLGFVLIALSVAADASFWEMIDDDSIDDVMKNSPGFRQMIVSSCEQITLSKSGYPKNIPKKTVDKLCMRMYPGFGQKPGDKKFGMERGKLAMFSGFNAIIV